MDIRYTIYRWVLGAIVTIVLVFQPTDIGCSLLFPQENLIDQWAVEFRKMIEACPSNKAHGVTQKEFQEAEDAFRAGCRHYRFHPMVIYRLYRRESVKGKQYAFNEYTIARGYGQVTPILAWEAHVKAFGHLGLFPRGTVFKLPRRSDGSRGRLTNAIVDEKLNRWVLYRPKNNIAISMWFLDRLRTMYDGDVKIALKCYGIGPGNYEKWVVFSEEYSTDIMGGLPARHDRLF